MAKKHIITLGGYPGSGKSTAKNILGERLGYRTFSTGDFARSLAISMGMTLEEFNIMGLETKAFDEQIDAELMRIEAEEDYYIVDSHLAFHFIPSGFSVFLDISLHTSAERIFNDNKADMRIKSGDVMETFEEALLRTEKRIKNHEERYFRHYGIDPYVSSQYDMVIDAEHEQPEHIVTTVLERFETWIAE